MKSIKVFILFSIIIFSCSKKNSENAVTPPSNILQKEEMKNVMIDVIIAEGCINIREAKRENTQYNTHRYYDYAFKKNFTSRDQFLKSFEYYSKETDQMDEIMNAVVEELNRKQGGNKVGGSDEFE
jgi:Domain of unknown function (DUF4296)